MMLLQKYFTNLRNNKLLLYGLLIETTFILIMMLRDAFSPALTVIPGLEHFMLMLVLLTLALFVYVSGYDQVKKKDNKLVIWLSVLFVFTAVFIKPIRSFDVFTYISIGRVVSVHQANPYQTPYEQFHDDAFYSELKNIWSSDPAVYGPVFVVLSSVLTYSGGNSIWATYYLYKLTMAILFFLSVFVMYKLTNNIKAVYLFSWNPFIVFMTTIDLHNNLLWIFLFLAAVYYLKRSTTRSNLISAGMLALSVLSKFFALLIMPFWLIYTIIGKKPKNLLTTSIFYMSVFAVLGFIFYAPFWYGAETLGFLFDVNNFNSPLTSPLILLFIFIARIFGGAITTNNARLISQFLFVGFYLWRILVFYKDPTYKNLIKEAVIVLFGFVLTSLAWFMPWYLLPPLIVLIAYEGIIKSVKLRKLVYMVSLYGLMYSLIVG